MRIPLSADVEPLPRELAGTFSFAKYNRIAFFNDTRAGYFHYFEDRNRPHQSAIRTKGTLPGVDVLDKHIRSQRVISGGVSSFGYLIEVSDALSVIRRDGVTTRQSPARWRVFPRAKRYHGIVALVDDDRVEFVSYAESAHREQKTGRLGTSVPRQTLE
jgi:hypothetical protein